MAKKEMDQQMVRRIDAVVEQYANFEKGGATIPYDQLESITGLTHGVAPWSSFMRHLHKRLRKYHDRWFVPVRGVGIRFASDREMVTVVCDGITKSARKKMRLAIECLSMVSDANLTESERLLRDLRLRQIRHEMELARTHAKERRSWFATVQPQPKHQLQS